MLIDGMDQKKTVIPRLVCVLDTMCLKIVQADKNKEFDQCNFVKFHLHGVIVHGRSFTAYNYAMTPTGQ
jgi:hypothetical protein